MLGWAAAEERRGGTVLSARRCVDGGEEPMEILKGLRAANLEQLVFWRDPAVNLEAVIAIKSTQSAPRWPASGCSTTRTSRPC